MTPERPIKDPSISVDRQAKCVACFDGFTLIRDFERYTNEQGAIADALKWFDERGVDDPKIVYPFIRKAVFKT